MGLAATLHSVRNVTLGALVALVLFGLVGCAASLKNDSTICEEYRSLRCITAPECSMDQRRGCRVCQCSPVNRQNPVPPDRRSDQPTSEPRPGDPVPPR